MSSSSSAPTSPINALVRLFGGKNGWLGYFYRPTIKEEADERYVQLERQRMRLEMDQEDLAASLRRLEKRTKRLWSDGREMEARQAARDLRTGRVQYTRLGTQKANMEAMRAKIEQLRSGTAVEDSLVFYVRAMGDRLHAANPERMAHVLARCEQLQSLESMTNDLLEEYFADEEAAERERAADEIDDDRVVDDVLIELGLKTDIRAAPPTPVGHPPEVNRGGGGGGGGGGNGSGGGGGGGGGANDGRKAHFTRDTRATNAESPTRT